MFPLRRTSTLVAFILVASLAGCSSEPPAIQQDPDGGVPELTIEGELKTPKNE